jgi:hypothetical protein
VSAVKKPARAKTSTSHKPVSVWIWPTRLWHGTSEKGLRKLRSAALTEGLYLTNNEDTACDYAESAGCHDKSTPMLVEINVAALRKAGGSIGYDFDGDDVILEQILYRGPLPRNLVLKASTV